MGDNNRAVLESGKLKAERLKLKTENGVSMTLTAISRGLRGMVTPYGLR